jgi:sigma-B regulation protein RsbU (phosphoserine phosphatase)
MEALMPDSDKKGFTILIVDDTYTNLLILKKTLSNAGYSVLSADNGPAGRDLAQSGAPDLILLDIMMPGEDGFETITRLKNNPATANIPVIFLTAVSDVDSKVRGFELGAVDFITKPFHPAEIKARVSLHVKLSIATNALIERQREKLRQLESAQQAILTQPSDLPGAKFAVFFHSLHEAGGDFYEALKISADTYAYFAADFSGHDIATGFFVSSVKALLRQNCSPVYSAAESMRMINNVLLDVLPAEKYLTACYLTVNRRAGRAIAVNMGHPPALHCPAAGAPSLLRAEGDVLAAFPDVVYTEQEIEVSPGDRIYIFSDGLVEGPGGSGVWSAETDSVLSFAGELRSVSLEDSVKAMNAHFFPEGVAPQDDVMILGVEV